MRILVVGLALAVGNAAANAEQAPRPQAWGTAAKPFAADSLWNSRPVAPVLGTYVIPKTAYFPLVGESPYSTKVFLASPDDSSVTIANTWSPDDEQRRAVTIPHWPSEVVPAQGTDGHADIIDATAGVIHSFWQLHKVGSKWEATQYAWAPLNGSGWGEPGHYFQGARAAGVPTSAGLIRKDEIDDGDTMYRHVLAVSLDDSALKRGYVFPATSEDENATLSYAGEIPMGSLLMLPKDFDTSKVRTPRLRKVAETLKVYGGRVVDRNFQTRFQIPAEIDSGFDLHAKGWDSDAGDDLELIADHLRVVTSNSGFISGDGKQFVPELNQNQMSMRGQWTLLEGKVSGGFDTWRQSLIFPPTTTRIVQAQYNRNWARELNWAKWETGQQYKFTVAAAGGATLRIEFKTEDGTTLYVSGDLADGESATFAMPDVQSNPSLVAKSGIDGPSSVRGHLVPLR